MASVALGFAGQAIGSVFGGPLGAQIGGFIGSTLGGLIDNQLFPQKAQGPRLDDLTVTASTYGKPLPLLYGPENRIAGNVIWSTGLIETRKTTKQGGKGAPSVSMTEFSYRASFAVVLSEGVINRVRKIWANNKVIYDVDAPGGVPTSLYSALRVYPGNHTQNPDPTIEAYVGAGQTPAYRGSAYVVFADLQLADFGNRLPNLEFLVEAQPSTNVAAILGDIANRCGLQNNFGMATMTQPVRGYAIGQAASGVGAIQPLALAFDFDVSEVGGGLRATKRTSGPAGVVLAQDIGAHEAGSEMGDPIRWSRRQVTSLPREASVTFADPERDWQANTQVARRSWGSADSNLGTQIAVVLSAEEGKQLADRMLWEAWTGQQTAETAVSDRWLGIMPGRLYYFETPAGLEPLRVTRATRGWNGVTELAVTRDRDEVYLSNAPGVPATVPPNDLSLPGLTTLIMLDIPLLLDADDVKGSGFYWGVLGSGQGWRGADLRRSVTVGGTYESLAAQGSELTVGDVAVATPAPAPGFDSATGWDTTTVIRVVLRRTTMTLEGMSDAEVVAGGNALYVGPASGHGGEIIQFGVATFVSPGVYDLSRLRRGQRGTEFAWGSHVAAEMLVLLELGNLQRVDFGVADLNQLRFYKAVSLLTFPDDTPPVGFTNTGVGLRPYSPIGLFADGPSGGGDVLLTWVRRSRIGHGVIPPPLAEESEKYVLQIRNLAGTSTVRSVDLTAPTFTYTAAMQTADFGAPVTNLRWRVAQVSAVYGNGPFAESNGPV